MTETASSSRASILIFGHDVRLVETRKWILEKSGFELHTVFTVADLQLTAQTSRIDMFLLCDSLHARERGRALSVITLRFPHAKRLLLASNSFNTDLSATETVFPAIEGPRKLIAMIHNMMTDSSAPLP